MRTAHIFAGAGGGILADLINGQVPLAAAVAWRLLGGPINGEGSLHST